MVTPTDIGNIIRDRRLDRGMTQSELADAVGMSRQWIVRFENGNADTATLDHLLRLAEVLELDIGVSPS
ncbi:MAG TPA: helix-turn-helix transcriptional regulator [Humibacter sp.]|nr:helix-turn-helix transcriptional regulator [Humibacter sp.]